MRRKLRRHALQWGRRANATERKCRPNHASIIVPASMGPPRERDGELPLRHSFPHCGTLQWGRRANATERPQRIDARHVHSLLQWGRRANATESSRGHDRPHGVHGASMGPPRERDGETATSVSAAEIPTASMGPPRERDGEDDDNSVRYYAAKLQWGRRANATESASQACKGLIYHGWLQWGRRANATERRR